MCFTACTQTPLDRHHDASATNGQLLRQGVERLDPPRPEIPSPRSQRRPSDTVLIAGEPISIGTRVVLFDESRGYSAYRGARYFNERRDEAGGGPLPAQPLDRAGVEALVDRVVMHYDVAGCSSRCFRTLQKERGLSCHFLLDLDGTLYQTLDLRERAWHAGTSNSRSVGIEIANVGAYPLGGRNPFGTWYRPHPDRPTRLVLPADSGVRHPEGVIGPARDRPVVGRIHNRRLEQYDLTHAQYAALIKLTAALCRHLPRVTPDAPRDANGVVRTSVMPTSDRIHFSGLIGHHHLTPEKIDPGPAFDWPRLLTGVKAELAAFPASKNPSTDR